MSKNTKLTMLQQKKNKIECKKIPKKKFKTNPINGFLAIIVTSVEDVVFFFVSVWRSSGCC